MRKQPKRVGKGTGISARAFSGSSPFGKKDFYSITVTIPALSTATTANSGMPRRKGPIVVFTYIHTAPVEKHCEVVKDMKVWEYRIFKLLAHSHAPVTDRVLTFT